MIPIKQKNSRRILHAFFALTLVVALSACSIQISDVTPAPATGAPAAATASTLPTATRPAPPTATPPPWAALNLSGHLLYTQGVEGVKRLDLATGEEQTLLQPPATAWLTAAALSPDGKNIVLAYSPPPPQGQLQFGYTDLYLMPADGSGTPLPFLARTDPQESFFSPAWSPDGKYVYYAHFVPIKGASGTTFKYTAERIAFPNGKPEVIIENAIWPRLSPDGSKLAYLSFDPVNYSNELYLADPDGKNGKPVMTPGVFVAVDAHMFSPDGSALVFSAVGQPPAPALLMAAWFPRGDRMRVAAHNVPSDWWRVAIADGKPQRLTSINDTGMYGAFAPDGRHIAFISVSGMFVMNPDGNSIRKLMRVNTVGTIEWTP